MINFAIAIFIALFAGLDLILVCSAANKILVELVLDADPLSKCYSCPVLTVFLSIVQDSKDYVKLIPIDSMNTLRVFRIGNKCWDV